MVPWLTGMLNQVVQGAFGLNRNAGVEQPALQSVMPGSMQQESATHGNAVA